MIQRPASPTTSDRSAASTVRLARLLLSSGLALALLAATPSARAASSGQTAAEFLKIELGGRAAAMGGAATAVSGDLFALHYNPASIAHFQAPAFAFQHNRWFADVDQNVIAAGTRIGNAGVLAATVNWVGHGDLRRATYTSGNAGATLGTFSARDYAASLTWARGLSDRLDVGVTAKLIGAEIDDRSGTAFAVDAGLRWQVQPNWNFGLSLQNAGTELELDRAGSPLPVGVRAGTSLSLWDEALLLSLDLSGAKGEDVGVQFGAEYTWNRTVSIRAGYDSRNDDADEGLSVGAGVHYGGFDVDYAYTPFGDLGDAHRISLAYAFDAGDRAVGARAASRSASRGAASPVAASLAAPDAADARALAARRAAIESELGLPASTYGAGADVAASPIPAPARVLGPTPATDVRLDFRLIAGDDFPQAALLASMAESRLKARLRGDALPPGRSAKASLAVLDGGEVFLAVSLFDGATWLHTVQSRGTLRDLASVVDESTERLVRYAKTGDEHLRFAASGPSISAEEVR